MGPRTSSQEFAYKLRTLLCKTQLTREPSKGKTDRHSKYAALILYPQTILSFLICLIRLIKALYNTGEGRPLEAQTKRDECQDDAGPWIRRRSRDNPVAEDSWVDQDGPPGRLQLEGIRQRCCHTCGPHPGVCWTNHRTNQTEDSWSDKPGIGYDEDLLGGGQDDRGESHTESP